MNGEILQTFADILKNIFLESCILQNYLLNNIVVCRINHYSYLRIISLYMIHTSHDFYITRERTMVKIFKYFVKNISLEDHKRSICFRFSNISIVFLWDTAMWIRNHFIFQYPDWKVNILSKQFFVNTNSFNLWLHIESP